MMSAAKYGQNNNQNDENQELLKSLKSNITLEEVRISLQAKRYELKEHEKVIIERSLSDDPEECEDGIYK